MSDPLTPGKRSALMKRVRTRDTGPEVELRKAMWAGGLRGWRVHPPGVFGKPDIAWVGRRVAIFVDGAFWHGHPDYYQGQSGPFWDRKIARNRERDAEVTKRLENEGWKVLRFWDFEVSDAPEACIATIQRALSAEKAR